MRGWPKLHAKIPSRLRDQRHAEVQLKTHEDGAPISHRINSLGRAPHIL
jgi:hypothetical protein